MMLDFYQTCICSFFCSPFQRRSSRVWLPSPTRLTPGQQTQGELISHASDCFYSALPWPDGLPFRWSPELLHLSSQGPWRPASPLCRTRGRQHPQTPCWRQNRRSWHGRRHPAAGWMVWCLCGWSCGSALGNQGGISLTPWWSQTYFYRSKAVRRTVLDTQEQVSEVKTGLLLCERFVCGHLHHRPAHHDALKRNFWSISNINGF